MKLTLKNIGKIGSASVELSGITVIAGLNDTGKSTVGRALFALMHSFCNAQETLYLAQVDSVNNLLTRLYMMHSPRLAGSVDITEEAKAVVEHFDEFRNCQPHLVQQRLVEVLSEYDAGLICSFADEELQRAVSDLNDILSISDTELLNAVLERMLNAEFNNEVRNISCEDDGELQLQIGDTPIAVSIDHDGCVQLQSPSIPAVYADALYIDSPFVLDEQRLFAQNEASLSALNELSHSPEDHRTHLRTKLFAPTPRLNSCGAAVVKNRLKLIYEKLSTVCSGDVVLNKRFGLSYKMKGSDKAISVRSLSIGLKSFVILKMLLSKGAIERSGTLIWDEPEAYLHPEWQLIFAELMVLLHKKYGVHVLLNTHSPYLLRAIQVYSAKYECADICKYYLAEANECHASITDATDDLEQIYATLVKPLQAIENEPW